MELGRPSKRSDLLLLAWRTFWDCSYCTTTSAHFLYQGAYSLFSFCVLFFFIKCWYSSVWWHVEQTSNYKIWPLQCTCVDLPELMDALLLQCFLHALKSKVKKSDLPLLTSTFLRNHMFSCWYSMVYLWESNTFKSWWERPKMSYNISYFAAQAESNLISRNPAIRR